MTTDRSGGRAAMGARWLLTPAVNGEGREPGLEVGPIGSRAPLHRKSGPTGAKIDRLSPEMKRTFPTIVETWDREGGPTPVITSGNDGRHKRGSKHYTDDAIDLRCNNLSDEHCQRISDALSRSLGPDYDVQFERFSDPNNDHIHLEYDPKPRSQRPGGHDDDMEIGEWMGWRNGSALRG